MTVHTAPVNLDFFKGVVSSMLIRNPDLENSDLSGVIAAQIVDFKGYIQISDCDLYSFSSDGYEGIRKPAKIIYMSSYGFWQDLFVTIKRIFMGVVFGHSNSNGDLQCDLIQGRRITIFCALDGSEAEVVIERNQDPLFLRIYKTIFSCC